MHQPEWSTADSPFHLGERRLQESAGVRERIESIGRRVIRNYMPDEHRAFFAALPFLVIGTLDEHGQPWASIINGEPGFVSAPDGTTLQVRARPQPNDPLARNLRVGADVASSASNSPHAGATGLTASYPRSARIASILL
jgi:uncharacterized protein